MITNEMLSRFSADFNAEKCHKIAMNAVTQNGVTKSAMSPMALRKDEHQFSINLKQGEITNQKSSGRCWMFAALNTMRFRDHQEAEFGNLRAVAELPAVLGQAGKGQLLPGEHTGHSGRADRRPT